MRAFLAIDIPRQLEVLCHELQIKMKYAGVKAKWVIPQQLHLTVKFLGEIKSELADTLANEIGQKVSGLPTFSIGFGPLGAFPNWEAPSVVWLGVNDKTGNLFEVHKVVQRVIEKQGWPRETKPYTPHITIGRVKEWPKDNPEVLSLPEFPLHQVNALRFMESKLTPKGPLYRIHREILLQGYQ